MRSLAAFILLLCHALTFAQHEGFFLVFVKSREKQLGLYLREGGYIDGFTPQSELGSRQSGVRIGDRVVSVNAHAVAADASADEINDVILSATVPFALVIAVDASTSAARRAVWLQSSEGSEMVIERELRHAQDADEHHLGTGLDVHAYVRAPSSGADIPLTSGGQGIADGRLVIKQNQSLSVFLSDGPFKTTELPASSALFGTPIAPGQCVTRRLLYDATSPQACSSSQSRPRGADSFLLARRGACSFQHKALHASLAQADGVLIVNSDEAHFAAPADPSLSPSRGQQAPLSVYALMLPKSAGEAAIAAYEEAAQRGGTVEVRVCSALVAADAAQQRVRVPVLYKGQRVLEGAEDIGGDASAPAGLEASVGLSGVTAVRGSVHAPELLRTIPRHPLEDSMDAAAAAGEAARRARQRLLDVIAALPPVALSYASLVPPLAEGAGSAAATEEAEAEARRRVHEGLRLQHQSPACLIFLYSPEVPMTREEEEEEERGGEEDEEGEEGTRRGKVTVRMAVVPCRGTSDAAIVLSFEGLAHQGMGPQSGAEAEAAVALSLPAAQMDALLSHALADSRAESLGLSPSDRKQLAQLAASKETLFGQLVQLRGLDHTAEGGEGPDEQGGSLTRLRSRLVKTAMEAHLPPLREGGAAVYCQPDLLRTLVVSTEGGALKWAVGQAAARLWLSAAGLAPEVPSVLLSLSLRAWLQSHDEL